MKYLFSTALSVGFAGLMASAAMAQGSPRDTQSGDPNAIDQPQKGTEVNPYEQPMTAPEGTEVEPTPAPTERPHAIQTTPQEAGPYATQPAAQPAQKKKRSPGFTIMAGGGVFNYGQSEARSVTSLGGNYNARVAVGSRMPIAIEAGYIGTAQDIDALGLDPSAALVSNGVEGVVRLNLVPRGFLRPYLMGGAGWSHYSIANKDFNNSSIRNSDNIVEVPVGGGVGMFYKGFVADARGDYRFTADNQLFENLPGSPNLNRWDVTLNLGVEF